MLRVAGIGDYLEEPLVPRGATDILRWASSRTCDTGGTAGCGIEADQPLEGYAVLPVVTEIINIEETVVGRAAEVPKSNLSLIK